jgi:hypothetical protein
VRNRLDLISALEIPVPLIAGTEYSLFRIAFNHAGAMGACTGCSEGACISLAYLYVTQPAGIGNDTLLVWQRDSEPHVTWNGGTAAAYPYEPSLTYPCDAATPARRSTWGQLKSLYH